MPNDEVIDFQCPKCKKRLKAGTPLAGRRMKCPKCQQPLTVPGQANPASDIAPKTATATTKPTTKPANLRATAASAAAAVPSSTLKQPTAKVPAEPTPLAKVPVAGIDDDWLNLGAPAIADVTARQQIVEESKAAKERERVARRNKERARQNALPKVAGAKDTAESLEVASQQRLRGEAPVTSDQTRGNIFDDDLPDLAPLIDSKSVQSKKPDSDANSKRSVFDDDLPELSELQTASKPKLSGNRQLPAHAAGDPAGIDELGALVPDLGTAPKRSRENPAGRTAGKDAGKDALPSLYEDAAQGAKDHDPEYRIECRSCGTAQYVRLSNQGMKIKCPDCFLQFKIPPPPAGWSSKKKPKLQLSNEDIPLSAAEELHHAQTLESQRSRASQLLEKAKLQVSDEDLERLYDGDFDTAGFVQRTFGFLKDPVAIAHIIGFAIVFAVLFALGQFAANNLGSDFGQGVLLLATIGGPLIGLLFSMPMLSGGLALIESVANRQKQVVEWPGFNIFDNAGDIAAILLALLGSMVPGFLVGAYLGGDEPGAGRIQIAGMMVTTFAFFPVILLSMLDNGSVFAPLSSSIFRSFSEASESWAGYYLKTFLAFSAVMLMWLLLLGKSEALAAIAGCLFPLLVFFTCQQIGALADGIGEHLSFEFVAPDKDEASNVEGTEKEIVQ